MARAAYLVDTSAFARLGKPHVAAAVAPLIAEGKIALCAPVVFELGFSARSASDHDAVMSRIDAFESVPTIEGDHRRALELQRLLAVRGRHRALSLVDGLVAAIAESQAALRVEMHEGFAEAAKERAEIIKSQARQLYVIVSSIAVATISIWIALFTTVAGS